MERGRKGKGGKKRRKRGGWGKGKGSGEDKVAEAATLVARIVAGASIDP